MASAAASAASDAAPDPFAAPDATASSAQPQDDAAPEDELVVRSNIDVSISWRRATEEELRRLTSVGAGVYIVERNNEPVYVGESCSIAGRALASLLRERKALGVGSYTVRLGTFRGSGDCALRAGVEHAVIRTLLRLNKPLRNRRSTQPFSVSGAVRVRQVVPYDAHLPEVGLRGGDLVLVNPGSGVRFEVACPCTRCGHP